MKYVLKILGCILATFAVVLFSFAALIASLFGDMYKNTVVQTVESPFGGYYAEVIDSDQGAMGGNTFVDVYEKGGIDWWIFKKKPQRIYRGPWGEYNRMEIAWVDENCLMINGVEYVIP